MEKEPSGPSDFGLGVSIRFQRALLRLKPENSKAYHSTCEELCRLAEIADKRELLELGKTAVRNLPTKRAQNLFDKLSFRPIVKPPAGPA